MLCLVAMDGYAARLPAQLSGSQQQRVALQADRIEMEGAVSLLPPDTSVGARTGVQGRARTTSDGIRDQAAGKNMEGHVYHESHTLHCGSQPLSANGFRLDKDSNVHTVSNCNAHRRSIVNLDARPFAMACRVPSECHPSGVRAEWRR